MERLPLLLLLAALLPASLPPGSLPTMLAAVPGRAYASQAVKPLSKPVIVCFGDSITAGYGVERGRSYPDDIQAELNARGYRYRVVNQGVSGNTTKDGVDRLADVLALKPAVAIVEFGGNDGLRGLPIAETRSNLERIVARLRQANVKVLLVGITLPPNYGEDYIRQFNAVFTGIAAKYHLTLLPMLYADVYEVPGAIQEDGIHPTAKGARLIAEHVLPLLLPMLHR